MHVINLIDANNFFKQRLFLLEVEDLVLWCSLTLGAANLDVSSAEHVWYLHLGTRKIRHIYIVPLQTQEHSL